MKYRVQDTAENNTFAMEIDDTSGQVKISEYDDQGDAADRANYLDKVYRAPGRFKVREGPWN